MLSYKILAFSSVLGFSLVLSTVAPSSVGSQTYSNKATTYEECLQIVNRSFNYRKLQEKLNERADKKIEKLNDLIQKIEKHSSKLTAENKQALIDGIRGDIAKIEEIKNKVASGTDLKDPREGLCSVVFNISRFRVKQIHAALILSVVSNPNAGGKVKEALADPRLTEFEDNPLKTDALAKIEEIRELTKAYFDKATTALPAVLKATSKAEIDSAVSESDLEAMKSHFRQVKNSYAEYLVIRLAGDQLNPDPQITATLVSVRLNDEDGKEVTGGGKRAVEAIVTVDSSGTDDNQKVVFKRENQAFAWKPVNN